MTFRRAQPAAESAAGRPAKANGDSPDQSGGHPAETPQGVSDKLDLLEREVERLAAEVGELYVKVNGNSELERARNEAERGLTETAAALRADIEKDLAPRQRRQELKLARQERDHKIADAERRLAERTEDALASIEREGAAAEARTRAAQTEAELAIQAVAGDAADRLEVRMRDLVDVEGRLTALMDQIAAAAERARSADERAILAEHRVLGVERSLTA